MISYKDITIEQYIKIINESDIDKVIDILFDIPDLDLMDIKEYNKLIISVNKLKLQKNFRFDEINIKGIKLRYKPIHTLTFGEYLDILNYIKNDDIHSLYCIFWRSVIKERTLLDNYILEDYNFDINWRKKLFHNESIQYYFQIKEDIERLDSIINKNYKTIFTEDKEEDVIVEDLDARTKAQYEHERKIKESFSKNAWEYTVYSLCNDDITKINEVYSQNLFTVFNFLKLRKDLELRNKK